MSVTPGRQLRFLRAWPALLVLLVVLILGAPGTATKVALSNGYFDRLLSFLPRECQPLPVEVVDINDASLQALGQWPWPRRRVAELVQKIGDGGAAVIVLAMVFSEPDRFSADTLKEVWPESLSIVVDIPDFDQELASAISTHRVVGATALLNEPNDSLPTVSAGFATLGVDPSPMLPAFRGALVNIPVLAEAYSGVGSFSVVSGGDQVARSVSLLQMLNDKRVPGLPLEALRVAQGADTLMLRSESGDLAAGDTLSVRVGNLTVPMTYDGQLRMHYSECEPLVHSALEIIERGTVDQNFSGKIILVGSSASALGDSVALPSGRLVPGFYVQAQAIEQMLQGWFLARPPWALLYEWMFVLVGSIIALLALRAGALIAVVTLLVLLVSLVGTSWWAFKVDRLLIDALTPGLSILVVFFVQSLFSFLFAEKERLWVRRAFSQYLSPALVQQLSDAPQRLRLGGEKREMTFLFSDIAGFTALTERTSAHQLVTLLNDYLDGACKVVMDHGGTIDKIVGDAIHAIFNAPLDQPDHAERAVQCALELDRFSEEFRQSSAAVDAGFGITRVGVNTGAAVVGNFGGTSRFDYTAHGDAINTAARLEAANKHLGTRICVAFSTVEQCTRLQFRPVAELLLKGKKQAVMVFEPMLVDDLQRAKPEDYKIAWETLSKDRFSAAQAFNSLHERYPDDPLLLLQLGRLNKKNWESVINLG